MSTAAATHPGYSTAKLLAPDYAAIQKAAKGSGVRCTEAFAALRLMMEERPDDFVNFLRRVREPQPYTPDSQPAG
jgi:hypothetical protein